MQNETYRYWSSDAIEQFHTLSKNLSDIWVFCGVAVKGRSPMRMCNATEYACHRLNLIKQAEAQKHSKIVWKLPLWLFNCTSDLTVTVLVLLKFKGWFLTLSSGFIIQRQVHLFPSKGHLIHQWQTRIFCNALYFV